MKIFQQTKLKFQPRKKKVINVRHVSKVRGGRAAEAITETDIILVSLTHFAAHHFVFISTPWTVHDPLQLFI